ncbi:MAG: glycosyltransferase [Nitrospinae bacterium]|nr:glycosyltransferase [Nitrospinota bacterium]
MNPPLASIVIPAVNNLAFNKRCIESVREHTDGDYEIVVVDNHSADGSREYFQGLGDKVRLICNDGLRTFAQSCNQGARAAAGEYLVFLNNDTYVTPGWLSAMVELVRSDPKIGMVGNKQLYPGNNLASHVGGVFTGFCPEHVYLFFNPGLPFLNCDREYQWVTAACALVPRNLFLETGGFCEEYRNSFEDVDLCFRLREKGYKIYYCHKSVIYHYGQGTAGRFDHEDANTRLFYQKWGHKIQADKGKYWEADRLAEFLKPTQFPLEYYLYLTDIRMDALRKSAEGLNRHVEAQRKHIEGLERRCSGLEKMTEDQKDHIEAIYNTLSWRVTKPIRAVKRLLLKMKGGGHGLF